MNDSLRTSVESSPVSSTGLIAAALACLLILGVGTVSYRNGAQYGHYLDTNDSWNAGYLEGKTKCSAHLPTSQD